MPSVYAHYRFGREVIDLLPESTRKIVIKNRELFDLGLQGPDLLFFYRPVYHNYVNQLGNRIHEWKGRRFFVPAIRQLRCLKNPDASAAYIYGMACHYALDSICHPFINQCVTDLKLSHESIEGAFERLLIVEDKLPLNSLITHSLKRDKRNAYIISQFYGRINTKQILKALRVMILCNDGLRLKDNLFKKFIFLVLRIIGKYESISGMVITEFPKSEFEPTDARLRELFEEAKLFATELIKEINVSVETRAPLSDKFDATFMG